MIYLDTRTGKNVDTSGWSNVKREAYLRNGRLVEGDGVLPVDESPDTRRGEPGPASPRRG